MCTEWCKVVPEAVEVEAWSSSGCAVSLSTRSISMTFIHWPSSFFSSASRCCVEIFSRARRSISCSYSFSFRFRVCREERSSAPNTCSTHYTRNVHTLYTQHVFYTRNVRTLYTQHAFYTLHAQRTHYTAFQIIMQIIFFSDFPK